MTNIIKRNRILKDGDDVFSQNAWDDAEWTDDMRNEAEKRIQEQREISMYPDHEIGQVEFEVTKKWEQFYQTHGGKFFKDRQWIFSEFPEILGNLNGTSQTCNILEVGCGVGNAVVHIINSNRNPNLHIYCCDISSNAIEILKSRELFVENKSQITAFQADICKDFDNIIAKIIPTNSMDFITLIFTMSALKPELMQATIANLATLLRPGGLILFRDYARYDLTQLRFKGRSYLRDNYYIRSDGTTSYFFTKQIVDDIFKSAGMVQVELKDDNRILVNRLKALKMCRCWIQAKYKKA